MGDDYYSPKELAVHFFVLLVFGLFVFCFSGSCGDCSLCFVCVSTHASLDHKKSLQRIKGMNMNARLKSIQKIETVPGYCQHRAVLGFESSAF